MLDRIKWASFGGFAVSVGMAVVAAVNRDVAWLVAAVFVLLVSLFGGRLQELVANKDGFRALFFDDYAKSVADQLPAPQPPQLPAPEERAQLPPPEPSDPKVVERTAEDHATATDSADVKVYPETATGTGTANAAAVITRQDVAEAKNPEELARRVIDYLRLSAQNVPIRRCGPTWEYATTNGSMERRGWIVANAAVGVRAFPPIGSTVSIRDVRYEVVAVRRLLGDELPDGCRPEPTEAIVELVLRPEQ